MAAFREASMHFENESAVHHALRRLVKNLEELAVPYAVAGDMAMFFHGYRRFTETLEVLTTAEGVRTLHQHCESLNYLPLTDGSTDLRDGEFSVRIHFLLRGSPPIHELPLPVNYPDPADASVEMQNLRVLALPSLIELKLAFGMRGLRYLRQLADVLDLIMRLDLPQEFSDSLSPLVRGKYWELWMEAHDDSACRRY